MNNQELIKLIKQKGSFLCVGLDFTEVTPIETYFRIIDLTYDLIPIYKLNLAFLELSSIDISILVRYIKQRGCLVIIDGKRGDIQNTTEAYKKVIYDLWGCDGSTLNPYMGYDSVKPFLDSDNTFSILLSLTSNSGGNDFQKMELSNGRELWEEVIYQSQLWERKSELWYVIGGNRILEIEKIRKSGIDNFLLIPGVGYQGGDLKKVIEVGLTKDCGLIINSSRSIIYSNNPREEIKKINEVMGDWINRLPLHNPF